MALIRPTVTPFPIFAPSAPSSTTTDTATTTEVRFSRWNNANAEKFNEQRRSLKEIEDDIRRHRRYQSALSIANLPTNPPPPPNNSGFKSIGTPSSPSSPSSPGKRAKYAKNPNPKPSFSLASTHPAFRKLKTKQIPTKEAADGDEGEPLDIKVVEGGVSYVVPGAPFEYMYSYTETPKAKPVALREPPITPFGPQTMPRPWTGRKPLPTSKKKLPEFDSFSAPVGKKGMKPVQRPGPFLPGSGPKYVWSREEILGEPLTKEEIVELIKGCRKAKRQLNMGRDGLTHNMLDNIHAHWKRRRVCKIKCKGVCTVDMDNVCQQLEEKTGGKIIYRRGGVLYLFRGRNYNYKTRPQFPLMLWKPVTPVYPRLIKRVPDGMTFEEVSEMRRKGRKLTPICRLAKNGVYVDLVPDVREAFEACELVRIDCQGMNPSDYRKIGGKLKDLVPCVLISFENEHILVWRGREWKSSFDENACRKDESTITDDVYFSSSEDEDEEEEASPSSSAELLSSELTVESSDANINLMTGREAVYQHADNTEASPLLSQEIFKQEASSEKADLSIDMTCAKNIGTVANEGSSSGVDEESFLVNNKEDVSNVGPSVQDDTNCNDGQTLDPSNPHQNSGFSDIEPPAPYMEDVLVDNKEDVSNVGPSVQADTNCNDGETLDPSNTHQNSGFSDMELPAPYMQDVLLLLRQAVESGSAMILDKDVSDADLVYKKSVSLAQVAPPGPVFRHGPKKVSVKKSENQETAEQETKEAVPVVEKKPKEKTRGKTRKLKGFKGDHGSVVPQGSLGVDELAKLLA